MANNSHWTFLILLFYCNNPPTELTELNSHRPQCRCSYSQYWFKILLSPRVYGIFPLALYITWFLQYVQQCWEYYSELTSDHQRRRTHRWRVVKDWPRPTNLHKLRGFLGLCTYYDCSVPPQTSRIQYSTTHLYWTRMQALMAEVPSNRWRGKGICLFQ